MRLRQKEAQLRGSHIPRGASQHHSHSHRPAIMSAAGAYDECVLCVVDYQTLRIGGLTFVAVIMILSVLLLASESPGQTERKVEEKPLA
uniref:FXYD domain-containing ion transport regulator 12 n=1 Tax=Oncorhynchus mykiss TaxID=8022 RepID=A0A8K9WXQ6_ONCMY